MDRLQILQNDARRVAYKTHRFHNIRIDELHRQAGIPRIKEHLMTNIKNYLNRKQQEPLMEEVLYNLDNPYINNNGWHKTVKTLL